MYTAAVVEGGVGICEPSVKMRVVFLYFVFKSVRKRAFPWSGQPDLFQGAGRSTEMKEEYGNHGPRGERCSTWVKCGGVMDRECFNLYQS